MSLAAGGRITIADLASIINDAATVLFANSGDNGKKTQFGSLSVTVNSGTTSNTVSKTFDTAFASTPAVIPSLFEAAGGTFAVIMTARSTTAFTAKVFVTTGVALGANHTLAVDWIAIG